VLSPSRRLYAHLCNAAAQASLLYLAGFLANAGVPKSVDVGSGPLGPALLVDVAVLVLFGVQHSAMARSRFHAAWAARLPPELERSSYVLASALVLGLAFWLWRPIPLLVYELESSAARALAWALFGMGWLLVGCAALSLGARELFGLADAEVPGALRMPWLYRRVRHPLQAGFLLALWAAPSLTFGHALLAAGLSAYIAIGLRFEERDLVRRFGSAYEEYRRRVPALLPRLPGCGRSGARALGSGLLLAAGVALFVRHVPRGARAAPALAPLLVDVGGSTRSAGYRAPDAPARGALLVLHGTGSSVELARAMLGTRWEARALAAGYLVVHPSGVERSWNGCRSADPAPAKRQGVDDVAFARALVARVREQGLLEENAPSHALGFSGGGQLAYRLALEAPDLVRAIAVFGANLPVPLDCVERRQPVSVFIVNGTADHINPDAGGDVIGPFGAYLGVVRSALETERYFSGLAAASETERVVLRRLPGAGHTLPGPDIQMPAAFGRIERSYDGLAEALAFFESLPERGASSSVTALER
jgi:poly(3-hydroxybutyrate) depolymerase/protein-S-isoprenylcysteine O-methyltransferase Ste14